MYNPYPHGNVPKSRNHQSNGQQIFEAILAGMKKEATSIDFYHQLVKVAPDQHHKKDLLRALEDKRALLNRLTELHIMLTGRQPTYEIEKVTFHTYEAGLQKAYQRAAEDYEEYRKRFLLTQHSPLQGVFLRACNTEAQHANRFRQLSLSRERYTGFRDHGKKPYVVNINQASKQNSTYRTAIWTGEHLQVTLMSINVGDDIGLEVHPDVDQFLRIEQGQGMVYMGNRKDQLDFRTEVSDDYAIMVPAGTWHNVINTGNQSLKLYSIYAPPEHPFGTVHKTKADAMATEANVRP